MRGRTRYCGIAAFKGAHSRKSPYWLVMIAPGGLGVLYRGPVRRMTNSTFVRRRRNDIGSLAESFRTRPRYVAPAPGRPRVAPSRSERLTGRR